MRKTRILLTLSGLALATSALAQFAVIDGANLISAGQRLIQLQQQYSQLVTTYNRITQQYNQMLTNAKYLSTLNAYRQVVTPWQGMSTTNTYGNTGAWIASVNNGLNTAAAWNTAGLPRMAYGSAMANVPAGQAGRVQANLAIFAQPLEKV